MAGQAGAVAAGALDTRRARPRRCDPSQPSRAAVAGGVVANDSTPSSAPRSSSAAATWTSRWVSTPPVICGAMVVIVIPSLASGWGGTAPAGTTDRTATGLYDRLLVGHSARPVGVGWVLETRPTDRSQDSPRRDVSRMSWVRPGSSTHPNADPPRHPRRDTPHTRCPNRTERAPPGNCRHGQYRSVAVVCVYRARSHRFGVGFIFRGVATVVMPTGADGRGPRVTALPAPRPCTTAKSRLSNATTHGPVCCPPAGRTSPRLPHFHRRGARFDGAVDVRLVSRRICRDRRHRVDLSVAARSTGGSDALSRTRWASTPGGP